MITSGAKTIDDFINTYQALADEMREWKRLGIQLDPCSGIDDDYAEFYTINKEAAIKAGFIYCNSKGDKLLLTRSGKEVSL
ncbi:MAG: hypothetical protein ACFFBP_01650 [Promethearchaeota archaeon]